MGNSPKGWKGFYQGMVCKGDGYERTYHEGEIAEEKGGNVCGPGMIHYCDDPWNVLNYYGFIDDNGNINEFAEVEPLDEVKMSGKGNDRKLATSKLKIGAKLGLKGFIEACVSFIIEKTKDVPTGSNSSGAWAQIGSSGNGAQIGSSGNGAQIGSSGDIAQIGSSGNGAKIGSSGNGAKIGSSGYGTQIGSSGYDSVVCCAGHGCKVKAKKGSWITLSEWAHRDDGSWFPKCVKTEQVDGDRIKEDTYYILKDGKFEEWDGEE